MPKCRLIMFVILTLVMLSACGSSMSELTPTTVFCRPLIVGWQNVSSFATFTVEGINATIQLSPDGTNGLITIGDEEIEIIAPCKWYEKEIGNVKLEFLIDSEKNIWVSSQTFEFINSLPDIEPPQ